LYPLAIFTNSVWMPQRSNPLVPTCHCHQLCVDAPEEGPAGAVRGGGLSLVLHAWAPHRQGLFITALPLAMPLAFSASSLSCLSPSSFSWSLYLGAASLSAGDWGFKNRARGASNWQAGKPFYFPFLPFNKHKTTKKFFTLNSVRRGLREVIKQFRFLAK